MAVLPGWEFYEDKFSKEQYIAYACVHYWIIVCFICLLALASVNIYQILYRQRRYRTLPLLFFYIFAMVGILTRIVSSIWFCTLNSWVLVCDVSQPAAKLCVGLVQSWMILELALRMRQSNKQFNLGARGSLSESSKSQDCLIKCGQACVLTLTAGGLLVYVTIASVTSARSDRNLPFEQRQMLLINALAYSFLAMFIIMAGVNIYLNRQMQARDKQFPDESGPFKRERFVLALVLLGFELSYAIRFFWEKFNDQLDLFSAAIAFDVVTTFDAISFIFLLLMHNKNFKLQPSNSKTAKLQTDLLEEGQSQVVSDNLNHLDTHSGSEFPSIQEIQDCQECKEYENREFDQSRSKMYHSHSRSTFKLLEETLQQSSRSFQEKIKDERMLVDGFGMLSIANHSSKKQLNQAEI